MTGKIIIKEKNYWKRRNKMGSKIKKVITQSIGKGDALKT